MFSFFSMCHLAFLTMMDPYGTLNMEHPCAVFGASNTPVNYYLYKNQGNFEKVLKHPSTVNVSARFEFVLDLFYNFHLFRMFTSCAFLCLMD